MFRADITIITNCPFSEFLALINEWHPSATPYSWDKPFTLEDGTDAYQFHFNGDNGQGERFYVWIYRPDTYTIAHEMHHLAHDILFTRGLESCYQNEEVFAYLTGRLHELYEIAKGETT
jgi:hypothetical protein